MCQKFLCVHFNVLLWLETGKRASPKALKQTLRPTFVQKKLRLVELCERIIILACS